MLVDQHASDGWGIPPLQTNPEREHIEQEGQSRAITHYETFEIPIFTKKSLFLDSYCSLSFLLMSLVRTTILDFLVATAAELIAARCMQLDGRNQHARLLACTASLSPGMAV